MKVSLKRHECLCAKTASLLHQIILDQINLFDDDNDGNDDDDDDDEDNNDDNDDDDDDDEDDDDEDCIDII